MSIDLPLSCRCGAVRGTAHVSPAAGKRVVCYCDDCQAFAAFLGRTAEVLDEHGGTDLFQTAPSALELTAGAERLACVRVTPRGPFRWYASCCKTPIANTPPTSRVPFVGLVLAFVDAAVPDASRDAALGPVIWRVFGKFARGTPPGPANERFTAAMALRIVATVLGRLVRGERRRSAFFDPRTGRPHAVPRVLGPDERARLGGASAPVQTAGE